MDLGPDKKCEFRANFGPEISFADPKYDADWYETIVGWSGDTGNTFLADLLDN